MSTASEPDARLWLAGMDTDDVRDFTAWLNPTFVGSIIKHHEHCDRWADEPAFMDTIVSYAQSADYRNSLTVEDQMGLDERLGAEPSCQGVTYSGTIASYAAKAIWAWQRVGDRVASYNDFRVPTGFLDGWYLTDDGSHAKLRVAGQLIALEQLMTERGQRYCPGAMDDAVVYTDLLNLMFGGAQRQSDSGEDATAYSILVGAYNLAYTDASLYFSPRICYTMRADGVNWGLIEPTPMTPEVEAFLWWYGALENNNCYWDAEARVLLPSRMELWKSLAALDYEYLSTVYESAYDAYDAGAIAGTSEDFDCTALEEWARTELERP